LKYRFLLLPLQSIAQRNKTMNIPLSLIVSGIFN